MAVGRVGTLVGGTPVGEVRAIGRQGALSMGRRGTMAMRRRGTMAMGRGAMAMGRRGTLALDGSLPFRGLRRPT